MDWTCPCGANNRDSSTVCRKCGSPLFGATPIPPRSQRRIWLIVLGIAVIGLIAISIAGRHRPAESAPSLASSVLSPALAPVAANPDVSEPDARRQEATPAPTLLTELRGNLANQREYDLRLIENASRVMNTQDRLAKIFVYCTITAKEVEKLSDSAPETEYRLQPDGTVLTTDGRPPKTQEQLFRDSQRAELEFQTGGGPIVQDCAGSLSWFSTWHNKPMPTDEQFAEIALKAKAEIDGIDSKLDPRLVEVLPKP